METISRRHDGGRHREPDGAPRNVPAQRDDPWAGDRRAGWGDQQAPAHPAGWGTAPTWDDADTWDDAPDWDDSRDGQQHGPAPEGGPAHPPRYADPREHGHPQDGPYDRGPAPGPYGQQGGYQEGYGAPYEGPYDTAHPDTRRNGHDTGNRTGYDTAHADVRRNGHDGGYAYDGAPYDGAPYDGAPYDGAPYDGAPYEGTPYDGAPYDGAPHGGQPDGGWERLPEHQDAGHRPAAVPYGADVPAGAGPDAEPEPDPDPAATAATATAATRAVAAQERTASSPDVPQRPRAAGERRTRRRAATKNGRGRRFAWTLAGLAALVAVAVAAVLLLVPNPSRDAAPAGGETPVAVAAPALSEAGFGERVARGDGWTVEIEKPRAYAKSDDTKVDLPGDATRAVVVEVVLTNTGTEPRDTAGWTVKAIVGSDPVGVLPDEQAPSRTVRPGASLTFPVTVPMPKAQSDLQLEAAPHGGAPSLFVGTA